MRIVFAKLNGHWLSALRMSIFLKSKRILLIELAGFNFQLFFNSENLSVVTRNWKLIWLNRFGRYLANRLPVLNNTFPLAFVHV